jgi:hypothetical protein
MEYNFAKKNRRSEIFVKSESSVLVTIISLTDCYALTHFSYGLFAINLFVCFKLEQMVNK